MSGGRVRGRLTVGGVEVPIRDQRLAAWAEAVTGREPQVRMEHNQLLSFRQAWPLLRAECLGLKRSRWIRLGLALGLVRSRAPFVHEGDFEAWLESVELVTREPSTAAQTAPNQNGRSHPRTTPGLPDAT